MTTTTAAPKTTMKGDVATAEPGLRSDPSVLWAGTFETTPDWKTTFGIEFISSEKSSVATGQNPAITR